MAQYIENDPTCLGPQHGLLAKQVWLTSDLTINGISTDVNFWSQGVQRMLYSPVRDFVSWGGNALCEVPAVEERSNRKWKPPTLIGRVLEGYRKSGRLRLHAHSEQHIYSCSANWESSREKFYLLKMSEALTGFGQPWSRHSVFFREVECVENQPKAWGCSEMAT